MTYLLKANNSFIQVDLDGIKFISDYTKGSTYTTFGAAMTEAAKINKILGYPLVSVAYYG